MISKGKKVVDVWEVYKDGRRMSDYRGWGRVLQDDEPAWTVYKELSETFADGLKKNGADVKYEDAGVLDFYEWPGDEPAEPIEWEMWMTLYVDGEPMRDYDAWKDGEPMEL